MNKTATVTTGPGLPSKVELSTGKTLVFDQTYEGREGDLEGPSSTEGVSAALASCTAVTLNVYAARKGWDLTGLEVSVETAYEGPNPSSFKVHVGYPEHLDADQIKRLERIATRCPVHRLLAEANPIEVQTT
jgi:putative redox protein